MIDDHACNAFCGNGEHCDLVHVARSVDPATVPDRIWQACAATERVWVTDARPAHEAPDYGAYRAMGTPGVSLTGAPPADDDAPWLVWWRTDYDAARADHDAGRIARFRTPVGGPVAR